MYHCPCWDICLHCTPSCCLGLMLLLVVPVMSHWWPHAHAHATAPAQLPLSCNQCAVGQIINPIDGSSYSQVRACTHASGAMQPMPACNVFDQGKPQAAGLSAGAALHQQASIVPVCGRPCLRI